MKCALGETEGQKMKGDETLTASAAATKQHKPDISSAKNTDLRVLITTANSLTKRLFSCSLPVVASLDRKRLG